MRNTKSLLLLLGLASATAAGAVPAARLALPAPAAPSPFFPPGVAPPEAARPGAGAAATGGAPGLFAASAGFHSIGFNEGARAAVAFDDGGGMALYVGGGFTQADSAAASRIARFTAADGWQALDGGLNGGVFALAVFDSGGGDELYAGGLFTTAGGAPATYIARWDGSSWSAVGGGMNGYVLALAVYDDGSGPALYAGGDFSSAGGAPASGVAKWNGSSWSALGVGIPSGVRALAVHDDGGGAALYAAGYFTSAGGAPAAHVARWQGGAWSALGAGLDAETFTLAVHDDGSGAALYAGGNFTNAGGAPAARIARWQDGAWSAVGAGFDRGVLALASFTDGGGPALYAGGSFGLSDATATPRLARFTGGSWQPVGGGFIDGSPNLFVSGFARWPGPAGAKLVAAGFFDHLDGAESTHIAAWDGAAWQGVTSGSGRGMADWVAALGTWNDGGGTKLYAGGDFTAAGGVAAAHVARWNGLAWSPLGTGVNGRVNAFEPFDDGGGPALFVAGEFTVAGGAPAGRIAKWNGVAWASPGAGLSGRVSALAAFDDGSGRALYAGGQFTSAGGVPVANVARWNGGAWSAVGGGLNDWVMSLVVFDAGGGPALYAGGPFRVELGGSVSFFAKWNGAAWVAVPGSPNGWIALMKVLPTPGGDRLVALGSFTEAGGLPANGVAMWDGVTWTPLPSSALTGIGVFDAGDGPALFAVGGAPALPSGELPLSRWSGSAWVAQGAAFDSTLASRLQSFDDGSGPALFVGGTFSRAGDVPSAYLARLRGAPLLKVPASTPLAEAGSASVPITLDPAGAALAALAFSLDYDAACLDPDLDEDQLIDSITWNLPPGFTTLVQLDPDDTDGEIDVAIVDLAPPLTALPAGELARIRFTAVCPLALTPVDAALEFSTLPAPSFGDLAAGDVAGRWSGGVVHLLPGPRGDCNANGALAVADLSAVALEIFDGDGSFWLDAPQPSFAGSPVGCDANANTEIGAADVTCANRLLFGLGCAPPFSAVEAIAPILEVSSSFDNGVAWLRGRLVRNGNAVGSLAFSLDLDPARFDLAAADADHDGTPDRLRFPLGAPGLAFVGLDAADGDGELDVLLADLAQEPLAEGLLVEIGLPAVAAPTGGYAYSADPAPSFGSVTGGDLPGIAVLGALLFSDGFESGNTTRWSGVQP